METEFFPWVNPWRQELREIMEKIPCSRPPALRRSRKEAYLFASDLPACVSAEACLLFLSQAKNAGWEAEQESGWLNLRKAGICRPAGWFPEGLGGEAACLRALACRHTGKGEASREAIRLMKAREEGPQAWESACRTLHQEWARRLRTGEALPNLWEEEDGSC